MRSSVPRSALPRSKWWIAEGIVIEASAAAPSCMAAGGKFPGGRRSRCVVVDACSWWANDRLAKNMDRPESIVENEDLPRLNGGEAMAELNQPRPHDPTAATHISRFFPSLFMMQLEHKWSQPSGRYRTLT